MLLGFSPLPGADKAANSGRAPSRLAGGWVRTPRADGEGAQGRRSVAVGHRAGSCCGVCGLVTRPVRSFPARRRSPRARRASTGTARSSLSVRVQPREGAALYAVALHGALEIELPLPSWCARSKPTPLADRRDPQQQQSRRQHKRGGRRRAEGQCRDREDRPVIVVSRMPTSQGIVRRESTASCRDVRLGVYGGCDAEASPRSRARSRLPRSPEPYSQESPRPWEPYSPPRRSAGPI